jgi:hypothetical protein
MVIQSRHLTGLHDQKPGSVAGRCRPQGDAVRWQIEIEEIGAHTVFCRTTTVRRASLMDCRLAASRRPRMIVLVAAMN